MVLSSVSDEATDPDVMVCLMADFAFAPIIINRRVASLAYIVRAHHYLYLAEPKPSQREDFRLRRQGREGREAGEDKCWGVTPYLKIGASEDG